MSLLSVFCQKHPWAFCALASIIGLQFALLIPCKKSPGPKQSVRWPLFSLQFQFINWSFSLTGSLLCQIAWMHLNCLAYVGDSIPEKFFCWIFLVSKWQTPYTLIREFLKFQRKAITIWWHQKCLEESQQMTLAEWLSKLFPLNTESRQGEGNSTDNS